MSTHAASLDDNCATCYDVEPLLLDPALLNVVPPLRFAMVEEGVYRGAYPTLRNLPFLRSLGLRTIVSLTPEEPTYDLSRFAAAEDITLRYIRVERYKGEVQLLPTDVNEVVQILINAERHPVYVHCLDGRHVVGLVIMGLRKLQLWDVSCSHLEYQRFTRSAQDEVAFIADYSGPITVPKQIPSWLWKGSWCDSSGKPKRLHVGIRLKFPSLTRPAENIESNGKAPVRGREGDNKLPSSCGPRDVLPESVAATLQTVDTTATSPMRAVVGAPSANSWAEGGATYVDLLNIAPARFVGAANGVRQTACVIHTERPFAADVRFLSLRISGKEVSGTQRECEMCEASSTAAVASRSGGDATTGSLSAPMVPPNDRTMVTGITPWRFDGETNASFLSAHVTSSERCTAVSHQQLHYVVSEAAGYGLSTEASGNTKKTKRRKSL